jgi:flagellar hook-basal body complex protein FliE
MVAAEKSGVAFDAMVQVRNKLVDAYQEIMNMPV